MSFSTYLQPREDKEKAILEKPDAMDKLSNMNILSHQSKKTVDNLKTQIGATNLEIPMSFDDLDSVEFENHCIEYVDYYRDEISEFANNIYFLNKDPKARKEHARTIFSLLHVGFNTYLKARKEKEQTD